MVSTQKNYSKLPIRCVDFSFSYAKVGIFYQEYNVAKGKTLNCLISGIVNSVKKCCQVCCCAKVDKLFMQREINLDVWQNNETKEFS